MKGLIINDIFKAVCECKNTRKKIEVKDYKFNKNISEKKNQFLIMIKPESLEINNGVNTGEIIKETFRKFDEYDIQLNACYILSGNYLNENDLMEKQYSILNKGAKNGLLGIPGKYRHTIYENYSEYEILGAYEFLDKYSGISTEYLEKESHKIGSDKIGNGTYLLRYQIEDKKYGIINAFHPRQLEHFYDDDSVVVTMDCSSNTRYEDIALKMIGFFNPAKADKESLRYYLYNNKNTLCIKNVGIFLNGFHISPSPLEGMFATQRYCVENEIQSISLENTKLGSVLIKQGLSIEKICMLACNPYIEIDGDVNSLFDVCEGKDCDFIVKFIIDNYEMFEF